MNVEMMELLLSGAMEMMEPTRTRLRKKNPKLREYGKKCGKLELKFETALEKLRKENQGELAEMFEEHFDAHEQYGYQTELFSYLQGYIDCMQLLSQLGALSGVNQKWVDKYLAQYPMREGSMRE